MAGEIKTFIAFHALIKKPDGTFLVTRRSAINDYKPGEYDLPGGTAEPFETAPETIAREVREETGLEVNVMRPIHVYSYKSTPERYQHQVTFECEYVRGEVQLNPEEHDNSFWTRPEELKNKRLIGFLDSLVREVLVGKNGQN